ncbi:BTB/POZ domain-containing protein [Aphelenchoides avenae]|nr:BTB/POZ domain-containing protein [Aphelenchus avenae]
MSGKTDLSEKGTLMLKINNVSTYMTKIRQRIESPKLLVAGIEWYIQAHPVVIDNVTGLSCYLRGENASKWTAWVDVTFRIVKQNGGGFGNKLLNAANGFVVGDSVEIRVDISVTDVCGASFNVFETVGAPAADIKLKVGDSVFYANKGYLSVVSSVFRDMFALTETTERKKEREELELKDLDAGEFKEFLGVIYPTHYPITDTNVISVFRIADRYDVKRVIADCEYHLFGANNVPWFDKLKLAVDLKRDHLKDHLISKMSGDDIKAVNQNENKYELGVDILQAFLNRLIDMHHS